MTERPAFDPPPWDVNPAFEFGSFPGEDETGDDERNGDPSDVVMLLAEDSRRAVALFRDPDAVAGLTRDLSVALVQRVHTMWDAAKANRPDTGGRRFVPAEVAAELQLLADAHDTLKALSGALLIGAAEAKAIAGEVVAEAEPDERKTATVKVGDGHGRDLKVTRTQPTEARADLDAIVDVITADIIGAAKETPLGSAAAAYGARTMATQLLSLLAAPKVKTTALDAYARRLEEAELFDLAVRLGHAYGRVSKGDPRVIIDRIERNPNPLPEGEGS